MTNFFDLENIYNYKGEVALWKVDQEFLKTHPIVFRNIHSLLFVETDHEELVIKLNGVTVCIKESCIVDILDSYQLEFISVPLTVSVFHLLYSNIFFMEMFKFKSPFPVAYVTKIRLNPILYLDNVYIDLLLIKINRIREILSDNNNLYQKEILVNELSTMFLEYGNILIREKFPRESLSFNNNKENLAMEFVKMLMNSGKEKHSVNFYANGLGVSNQYLARIVKASTGHTVHNWISQFLLSEIMDLLKDTNMNLQQIADKISFSDQAAITKFFKKHTGILPSEFKRNNPVKKVYLE
jgi:AraC family transcriptional regulator, transcriptional activator of pobA